jgi:hypothetical protein
MDIINKYRKLLLEENLKITLSYDYIDIVNYEQIVEITSTEALIQLKEGMLKITGKNMKVSKMLDQELLITGNILKVTLGSDTSV